MLLVIKGLLAAQGNHRIEILPVLFLQHRYSGQQRGTGLRQFGLKVGNKTVFHLVIECRNRRFRPDHQVNILLIKGQLRIATEGVQQVVRRPLVFLTDISLYQRHLQRITARFRPCHLAEEVTTAPEQQQQHQPGQPLPVPENQHQQRRRQCHRPAGAIHTQHRPVPPQRAVDLTATDIQPGKSAEHPASQPLCHDPSGRQRHHQYDRGEHAKDTRHKVAQQRRIETQKGDQPQRNQECTRYRHMTIHIDTDKHPGDTRTKKAGTKQQTMTKGPLRCIALPLVKQDGQRQGDNGKQAEGGKGSDRNGTAKQHAQCCKTIRHTAHRALSG